MNHSKRSNRTTLRDPLFPRAISRRSRIRPARRPVGAVAVRVEHFGIEAREFGQPRDSKCVADIAISR